MVDAIVIPGPIVKAICAVQSTLESVKKSQKNTHGGYMFASTDDIYAAVTRKMGEVGLVCMALEDGEPEIRAVEKEGKHSQWMKIAYIFVLATEEATWTHPKSRRTLLIQISGPQAFQAAQSYAEKSFLRSLFKIPTGDLDLDSLPENFDYVPVALRSRAGTVIDVPEIPDVDDIVPPKQIEAAPVEENSPAPDPAEVMERLRLGLEGANDFVDAFAVWGELGEDLKALPGAEYKKCDAVYLAKIDQLEAEAAMKNPYDLTRLSL